MTQEDHHSRLLVRIPEACDRLSLGRSTIYALIAKGEIKAVKVGAAVRIPASELERWVEEQIAGRDGAAEENVS